MRVDSRIRLPLAELPDEVVAALKAAFTHKNPQHAKLKAMGRFPPKSEPQTYETAREEGDWLSLPRGGRRRVRAILREHGMTRVLFDDRTDGAKDLAGQIPEHLFEMRDYQAESIDKLVAAENAILRAPTGSGKTVIAFGIAARINLPTLVVVPSGALFEQWLERAPIELGIPVEDVGRIGDGKVSLRPLTIAMQATLARRLDGAVGEEIKNAFGAVICDEVQRFAARTFMTSIDPMPARYRIGISAEETRKDRKEFLIHDLFGEVAHDVPRDGLIASGAVLDVEVRIVPTGFRTTCLAQDDPKRYLDQIVENEERMHKAINVVLTEVSAGEQVLVMSQRVELARKIDAALVSHGVQSGLLLGGPDNKKAFAETKKGLKSGRLRVGVGTVQATGTGLDMPSVGVGVIATPLATNRQLFGQVRGRICRPHGARALGRLWYLWDGSMADDVRDDEEQHLANLGRWNKVCRVEVDGRLVDSKEFRRELLARKSRRERESFGT